MNWDKRFGTHNGNGLMIANKSDGWETIVIKECAYGLQPLNTQDQVTSMNWKDKKGIEKTYESIIIRTTS